MVTIGNTALPGVQTNVESASSTGVNVGAPGQVGLVGQADLANGTASANEVEEIRTPVTARKLFGSGSPLAENVVAALSEGAYPVFAVATEEIDVTGEDLTGLGSTSGTLSNAPAVESADAVTFTIDSTEKTTVKTYDDPSTKTPGTDEAYFNPVTGDFELDSAPSTSGDVDYTWFDYDAATDALIAGQGEAVDVLGVVNENADAVSYAHSEVESAVSQYQFMVVLAGAAARIAAPSSFENPYDSSRIQLIYPARDENDLSTIGAYCGLRARLGIDSSPIFKRLSTVTALAETLSTADQEALLGEFVVPVADESRGARIVEDVTTVTDDNTEEGNMRQVLHRMIVDYVTEVVNENSERYIGKLHTKGARNSLRSNITTELNRLRDTNSITGFNITVEEVDAMTASVDVGIDTIDPLRNIIATITAGEIEGADE